MNYMQIEIEPFPLAASCMTRAVAGKPTKLAIGSDDRFVKIAEQMIELGAKSPSSIAQWEPELLIVRAS